MNPILIFLLLFVGIPLIELYLMIEIGSSIGALVTVFLVVFTAVLGGLMVRMQGFTTAMRVRDAIARNQVPAVEMLEGALLLFAGILLLLPGFLTDAIGFFCLIPSARRALVLWFLKRAELIRPAAPDSRESSTNPRIIEGEYRREDH